MVYEVMFSEVLVGVVVSSLHTYSVCMGDLGWLGSDAWSVGVTQCIGERLGGVCGVGAVVWLFR